MKGKISGFVAFAAGLGVLTLFLMALNWFPLAVDGTLMRRYGDFDEMRSRLGIRHILVPSYFPEEYRWPPTGILAQGKPYPAVVMEFERSDGGKGGEVGLLIAQAAAADFSPGGKPRIARVRERASYPLKGRSALLEVGDGEKGEICTRISWRENEFQVTVIARSTPFEAIRVAESMLR
ncbi:MAG: hypothetical protein C4529_08980 [Deltaproteobacteria bacterium]|nr:MAG: hypothetical protein C4529_08980 [Deltaproteobacteria bacterium]